MKFGKIIIFIGLGISVLAVAIWKAPFADNGVLLSNLPHVHAIALDPANPGNMYIATHKGFFVSSSNGQAALVSKSGDELMDFVVHPTDPFVLLASSHRPGDGNLGIIRSEDGGKSWKRLAKGTTDPVDFHAIEISKADTKVIYGAYKGLEISRDGGLSWSRQGDIPGRVFDLAASASDSETVYAATDQGLLLSDDAGKSWRSARLPNQPSTMVFTVKDGPVYAFFVGAGLMKAMEPSLAWSPVSNGFKGHVVNDFAIDPDNLERMFTVDDVGRILRSVDAGTTWKPYGS